MADRATLTKIAPEAYRHPLDQQATRALRAVPGFELAATKFSRYSFEKFLYNEYLASAVKVTGRQCKDVHALLLEACRILDMEPPALFLTQTPIVNAFALGREEPAIVLQTGLVELMDEEELLAVIAHELGHIHCGHTIYRLMALFVALMARLGAAKLGYGELLSIPIQLALLEWSRNAEFSADRAAILTVQDPQIVFSTLFKLTGGSPKIFAQMDRDEYLAQAEEYDRPDAGKLDKLYRLMIENERTHPIPVLRSREVLRWGAGEECRLILSGTYPRRGEPVTKPAKVGAPTLTDCPHCQQSTDTAFSFCTNCGATLAVERAGGSDV
jgi:Zn-dependent protease with chaperone function